jgi:hypothetical protein
MNMFKVRIKDKLNANSLLSLLRKEFKSIKDSRNDNKSFSLPDVLMSAYAMFSLKQPSLLAFRNMYSIDDRNLHSVYHIKKVPCDTAMREAIDMIETESIQSIFSKIFYRLQRAKKLEAFRFMSTYYLVSGDGTEYFSSKNIHCAHCSKRNLRDGSTEYYHQFYGAAIVHPDMKQVIPLCSEPIVKQDGSQKNDCERNASKRFMARFRKEHPKLKAIMVEDSLSSNAPHITELRKHDLAFILGVKQNDHTHLFDYVADKKNEGYVKEHTITEGDITHIFSFINDVPLNNSNQNIRVNFLEYWEINNKKQKTQHFSYVTDFELNKNNVYDIMRGGRARWKIENETFNTLKNQDYHFDHNYGHGKKNLSVNLAMMTMLAFLVDQTLEISCDLFVGALKTKKQRVRLWETIRHLFYSFLFDSMNQIYEAILFGHQRPKISIVNTS